MLHASVQISSEQMDNWVCPETYVSGHCDPAQDAPLRDSAFLSETGPDRIFPLLEGLAFSYQTKIA
jgi:hypothetical protein